MVGILLPQIQVKEASHILVGPRACQNVGRYEIEVGSVEFHILVEFLGNVAVVAQFVD